VIAVGLASTKSISGASRNWPDVDGRFARLPGVDIGVGGGHESFSA
jgi:hypothetical protein